MQLIQQAISICTIVTLCGAQSQLETEEQVYSNTYKLSSKTFNKIAHSDGMKTVGRDLQQKCKVSAEVTCKMNGQSCKDFIAKKICGVKKVTFELKYCNEEQNRFIDLIETNTKEPDSVTEAKVLNKVITNIDMTDMNPMECRTVELEKWINPCKKSVTAGMTVNGWIKAANKVDYCYAFDWIKQKPIKTIAPTMSEELILTLAPTPIVTQKCQVSSAVTCKIDGQNCIDFIKDGKCGDYNAIFELKYCNKEQNRVIELIETNTYDPDGVTEAKVLSKVISTIDMTDMEPMECRMLQENRLINPCKTPITAGMKVNGWIKAENEVDYCYVFDWIKYEPIPTISPTKAPFKAPTKAPTMAPTEYLGLATSSPTPAPTNDPILTITGDVLYTLECVPEICSNISIDSPKDCVQNVPFKHSVKNNSNEQVELMSLFTHDESGNPKNLLESMDKILEPGETYELTENIGVDFCSAPENSFTRSGKLTAMGLKSEKFHTPQMNNEIDLDLPFKMKVHEEVECIIDNNTRIECQDYIDDLTGVDQCVVDVIYQHKIENIGLSCEGITSLKVNNRNISLDFISSQETLFCPGDIVVIPQKKSINICDIAGEEQTFNIAMNGGGNLGREGTTVLTLSDSPPKFTNPPTMGPLPRTPCKGQMKKMVFNYRKRNCGKSKHSQLERNSRGLREKRNLKGKGKGKGYGNYNNSNTRWTCVDYCDSEDKDPWIVVKSAKRGYESETYFQGEVSEGKNFVVTGYNGRALSESINVQIFDNDKGTLKLIQEFTFDASCSNNLYLGDIFGSLTLVGYTDTYQGSVGIHAC